MLYWKKGNEHIAYFVDEEVKEILRKSAHRIMPETSCSKIHNAFKDGSISRQQKALLELKAVYAPSNLPREYRGDSHGEISLKAQTQWLINHSDELDSETQAAVKPFTVTASDPMTLHC